MGKATQTPLRETVNGPSSKVANRGFRKANSQREAEALELSVQVWELRKAGLSQSQIAKQLDIKPSKVRAAYERVINRMKQELGENAEAWIQLHIARLEEAVAFQMRVMKGFDVRPIAIKERDPVRDDVNPDDYEDERDIPREVPVTAYPSIDERLSAARDIVKSGESLRKLLGIDAPERKEVALTGVVGSVDLRELGGEELVKETNLLLSQLRTRDPEQVKELVASTTPSVEAEEYDAEVVEDEPQEVSDEGEDQAQDGSGGDENGSPPKNQGTI